MSHPESQKPPPLPEGVGIRQCPHCGNLDILTGLEISQLAGSAHVIGLAYKNAGFFTSTEKLHADLCRTCGTVVRFFVKEPNRKWVK